MAHRELVTSSAINRTRKTLPFIVAAFSGRMHLSKISAAESMTSRQRCWSTIAEYSTSTLAVHMCDDFPQPRRFSE